MEDCKDEMNTKKRARVDSESDSDFLPESKRVQVGSLDSRADSVAPEFNSDKPGIDLLDILDDSDSVTDRDPEIQDLDSVIRSFEEEILHPAPASASASYSGESQPDLGYLLEASDDELGLPPAVSPTEDRPKDEIQSYDSFGFENELPSYDPFGLGFGDETDGPLPAAVGWLEYSEESDFSDFLWRPESLPAL